MFLENWHQVLQKYLESLHILLLLLRWPANVHIDVIDGVLLIFICVLRGNCYCVFTKEKLPTGKILSNAAGVF